MQIVELLREDFRAIGVGRRFGKFVYPRFTAVVLHRLAHSCHVRGWHLPAGVLWGLNETLTGMDIHPAADIGPRFDPLHTSGVIIGEITAGSRFVVTAGVQIGIVSFKRPGMPTLGDNVFIGAKASIFGPVHIGTGARIGAHCLVMSDVAPGVTVPGVESPIPG